MKYFIVEGILKDSDKINEDIMKEHMAYTQKAMDEGIILVSGLIMFGTGQGPNGFGTIGPIAI